MFPALVLQQRHCSDPTIGDGNQLDRVVYQLVGQRSDPTIGDGNRTDTVYNVVDISVVTQL